MPYDVKHPPSKTKTLTAKGRRQWVHIMNSALAKGDSEAAAHRKAWGAVRDSGNRKDAVSSKTAMAVRAVKLAHKVKSQKKADAVTFDSIRGRKDLTTQYQNDTDYGKDLYWSQGGGPDFRSALRNGLPTNGGRTAPIRQLIGDTDDLPGEVVGGGPAIPYGDIPPSILSSGKGEQGPEWLQTIMQYMPHLLMGGGALSGAMNFMSDDDDSSFLEKYLPAMLGIGGGAALGMYNSPTYGPRIQNFMSSIGNKAKGMFS